MSKSEHETKTPKLNAYPAWAPRFWHGMRLGDWIRLLARNRFRIHPLRLGLTFTVTCLAVFNSITHVLQQLIFGRAVAQTPIDKPPIFVVGHWRSGTTLLHELLSRDERYAFPTTYECFAPNHFLLTDRVLPKILWILLPPVRPMDNMSVSFDHPQEDEFGLVSLGAPSPILKMAFPNDPPPYQELLDMRDVESTVQERWENTLVGFVRALTYRKRKQLVLKSPPHTGRIETLSRLFPGAKFVHITRDPSSMFPSNRRLWLALDEAQGLQKPRHKELDEFIFSAFERMYSGFESQRSKVGTNNICDVRYEDLVQDPVGQIQRVYDELELGAFDAVQPRIEEYAAQRKEYQPNRHELEPKVRDEIDRRWSHYIDRYGYAREPREGTVDPDSDDDSSAAD